MKDYAIRVFTVSDQNERWHLNMGKSKTSDKLRASTRKAMLSEDHQIMEASTTLFKSRSINSEYVMSSVVISGSKK